MNQLIKTCIKRPVTVLMVMFIVLMLGGVSLSQMKLDLMPKMEIPVAIVYTSYSGAGPEEVENLVTKTIEGAVANVENVDTIMSSSSEGTSMVMIQFVDDTNMDNATNWLREGVDMVKGYLPEGADNPTIMKLNMNSMPIAMMTIQSENLDANELKALVEDKIESRLESQEGVASVDLYGGSEKEIVVELDQDRMEGLGLEMSTVSQILAAENTNIPGGSVDYGDKTYTISSKLQMKSLEDVKETPISLPSGTVIQLQDIANVQERQKDVSSYSRVNGEECIMLSVTKASDANTVEAVNNIKKELESINSDYKELTCEMVNDQAEYIELVIGGLVQNIFLACGLAIFILFIFLKNVGLTAVIGVSIPMSIIATFVLLYFSGTTLNILSLGGLTLGVGMLVDNSVVVIESIYSHRNAGMGKVEGTYEGTRLMTNSIVGSTLTTVVIFVPFAFATGLIMDMFRDMAMSVIFSLLASLVMAMTVVPMLAGNVVNNIHRNHAPKQLNFINRFISWVDRTIKYLNVIYSKALAVALRKRKSVLAGALALFVGSLCLLPFIGMELMPAADEGSISISVNMPKGTNLETTNEVTAQVEQFLTTIPEVEKVSTQVSGSSSGSMLSSGGGSITVSLVDKNQRDRSTDDVADAIRQGTRQIPGCEISVSAANSMMGGSSSLGSAGISLEVRGEDLDVLRDVCDQLIYQIEKVEGTREVTSSLEDASKEVAVHIDRDKARQYGLVGANIASGIRTAVDGTVATTLKKDGDEEDIRLTYPNNHITDVESLQYITIRTPMGGYVPLSAVAEISLEDTPTSISRMDQGRYATVSASIYGRDTGSVSRDVNHIIETMNLPTGYSVSQGGSVEQMMDAFGSMGLVLVMAIALVYMVMAAQFESLLYPFIIMFTMPLSTIGSFFLLFITGQTLSMPSLIGFLMLVGIVVNNGIILVDSINHQRKEYNMQVEDAILEAAPKRLRPILMTALTTILGMFPMIFSMADGAEMQRGMGLVVAGGLTTSTFLTLFVVPVLYVYFNKLPAKWKKRLSWVNRKNRKKEVVTSETTQ
ncbi:MAG: efflux RND transporter permease subunit [Eubacteriales bacterium]|jgi:CzcA family heavy metal efflux pump